MSRSKKTNLSRETRRSQVRENAVGNSRSAGRHWLNDLNFYKAAAVCGLLMVAVFYIYGQTEKFDYINYDDDEYVFANRHVAAGLTGEGIAWAFTACHSSNWHPVTWLSHMLDCQLYGVSPGNHHITNVTIHALTSILLFLLLRSMTGELWPSAFVAAVFAVHPLRVESVAWVSERKDLLCGLFFMLTVWAYIGYARHKFSVIRYAAVIVLFALGLMSKPMLVSLPIVLLLLDYWPLKRTLFLTTGNTQPAGIMVASSRLFIEKIPLFFLSAASCGITIFAQKGAIAVNEKLPMAVCFENAAISYLAYIGKLFYPTDMAVIYPHPFYFNGIPFWKFLAAAAVLAAICVLVIALWRRCPYLFVGWWWYVIMLLPVIGIVQVGWLAMADRYTYLPQIGICIALVWGIKQITISWPYRSWIFGVSSAVIVLVLMNCAKYQTTFWYNTESIWPHTLNCTSGNYVAHTNYGKYLVLNERKQEAYEQFIKAIEIRYDLAEVHSNLGAIMDGRGNVQESLRYYKQAIEIKPDLAEAYFNLALLYAKQNQSANALDSMHKAREIAQSKGQPDLVKLVDNWLNAYRP